MSLHARVLVCAYRACINGRGALKQWSEGMKKFHNCVWFKNSVTVYDRLFFSFLFVFSLIPWCDTEILHSWAQSCKELLICILIASVLDVWGFPIHNVESQESQCSQVPDCCSSVVIKRGQVFCFKKMKNQHGRAELWRRDWDWGQRLIVSEKENGKRKILHIAIIAFKLQLGLMWMPFVLQVFGHKPKWRIHLNIDLMTDEKFEDPDSD